MDIGRELKPDDGGGEPGRPGKGEEAEGVRDRAEQTLSWPPCLSSPNIETVDDHSDEDNGQDGESLKNKEVGDSPLARATCTLP